MKVKFFYILFVLFISGCNEFIDLTGKFINRLNDSKNLNTSIIISAYNLQTEHLPNILISIIDDQDSLFITTPKFTDENEYLTFTLPDEQIKSISAGTKNIIIVAEHPLYGIFHTSISINEIYEKNTVMREFILDLKPSDLPKKNIKEFQFYDQTTGKSSH